MVQPWWCAGSEASRVTIGSMQPSGECSQAAPANKHFQGFSGFCHLLKLDPVTYYGSQGSNKHPNCLTAFYYPQQPSVGSRHQHSSQPCGTHMSHTSTAMQACCLKSLLEAASHVTPQLCVLQPHPLLARNTAHHFHCKIDVWPLQQQGLCSSC